jgi:hypothetical protein
MHGTNTSLNRLAFSATAHCLTGCAIGEVLGLLIGTAPGDVATGDLLHQLHPVVHQRAPAHHGPAKGAGTPGVAEEVPRRVGQEAHHEPRRGLGSIHPPSEK